MTDQTKDDVLREFIEFRFQDLNVKVDKLTDGLERLTGAIVTREYFDELSGDVRELHKENDELRARLAELEPVKKLVYGLVGTVLVGVVTAVLALVLQ